jgi:hypothetical protein
MMNQNLKIALGAFITWLIPLVVSFGLYNPETNIYLPNYLGFKLIMALLAAVTCFMTMRWISKSHALTPAVPATYIVLNSVLDLIVLVGAFKMPSMVWATTIFPIYVLVFAAIYLMIKRQTLN